MEVINSDWVADIAEMHTKYGVNAKVREFDKEKLQKFLEFRISFLQEELDEMKSASNGDDVVDALIDLCVVAIGTLDAFDVDAHKAWDRVHTANMSKQVGIKPSRPNPLGLPDLIKPEGWTAPTHVDNVGLIEKIYD
jgi:predicted HAD superfamily Cof-like phosphohydrolase